MGLLPRAVACGRWPSDRWWKREGQAGWHMHVALVPTFRSCDRSRGRGRGRVALSRGRRAVACGDR